MLTTPSRQQSYAHRSVENQERAKRLRQDWLIRHSLKQFYARCVHYSDIRVVQEAYLQGVTDFKFSRLEEIEELLKHYAYLDNVDPEAYRR